MGRCAWGGGPGATEAWRRRTRRAGAEPPRRSSAEAVDSTYCGSCLPAPLIRARKRDLVLFPFISWLLFPFPPSRHPIPSRAPLPPPSLLFTTRNQFSVCTQESPLRPSCFVEEDKTSTPTRDTETLRHPLFVRLPETDSHDKRLQPPASRDAELTARKLRLASIRPLLQHQDQLPHPGGIRGFWVVSYYIILSYARGTPFCRTLSWRDVSGPLLADCPNSSQGSV